ncbi:unnamed protein product (macronuclear) [Paramecium tetraurelia]|uniref:Tr-type G domain-containing protein n=1 Tax=Paramecium tetraurelia TaxID=5888 RepID=A0CFS3_PARTE|nr:uncharacterized protein GSPATT00038081001 [Paramecium tetraurelia]CAK69640.1 unnamed protein product [Paramecium tetraurelia]|eukprot:XP_001437037.1 hypothetical protein (macronuclear) [Paramecium tetraurelia strain d4-2]
MQIQRKDHSKLAIIGNVDSGKSTLVGVLTKGILDDGRGGARERVFNYKHEKENGRTSSVAQEIMGFDENLKQVLPERFNQNKNKYWSQVVEKSEKIVTFLDLCGHEKYLKTTIFGLVAMIPDYSLIIVGANMGVSKMTREHLGVSLFLKNTIRHRLDKSGHSTLKYLQRNYRTYQISDKESCDQKNSNII